MKKNDLLAILGYLNIGLAVAHNAGVTAGHFGSTDFLQLAQAVNGLLIGAIEPGTVAQPFPAVGAATSTTAATN